MCMGVPAQLYPVTLNALVFYLDTCFRYLAASKEHLLTAS